MKPNGWFSKPIKLQLKSGYKTNNFDAFQMLRINQSRHRTWLHVSSGTLWSISSDTQQVVEIPKGTSTKMNTPFNLH